MECLTSDIMLTTTTAKTLSFKAHTETNISSDIPVLETTKLISMVNYNEIFFTSFQKQIKN